jgi:3-dehydroquinate dehydratase/shikimate dehydrogenase
LAEHTSTPLICETITAETTAGLRIARDRSRADVVELRLDGLSDPDARAALSGRSRPAVVTCRPVWEGGNFDGAEEDRERLLMAALDAGADYVDVEWRAPFRERLLTSHRNRVVLSAHDFGRVPPDLDELVDAMLAAGPAIAKIALAAHRLADLLPLLSLARGRARGAATVLIGMGTAGIPSRLLAHHFGSCWIYAGAGVAPGQIPLDRLLHEFRVRRIGPHTSVYGVVGRPVTHSASPAMHNAAYETLGIDAAYVPFEAADFDDFQRLADVLGVEGASVTAPFKREAFTVCRTLDEDARRLGVVNTLRRDPGGLWSGRNTDVAGFMAPLHARDLQGRRVALLGAGGAARAVAQALSDQGALVTVYARREEAAGEVAGLVGGDFGRLPPPAGSWDVLVNATPVGTAPDVDSSPMSGRPLDGTLVYDLVYNPTETRLVREARAAGLDAIGGLDMLVAQAARQLEWWTGQQAPESTMASAARVRLGVGRMPRERVVR